MSKLKQLGRFGQKVQHLTPVTGDATKKDYTHFAMVNIAVFEEAADGKNAPSIKAEVSATGSGKTPEAAEDDAFNRALNRLGVE